MQKLTSAGEWLDLEEKKTKETRRFLLHSRIGHLVRMLF